MNGTDFLTGSRRIRKLYEARISRVCGRYGLTQIETDILAFLSNHPGKDTAGDIVRLRMLQKGNVSQAVETLIQKGFLTRTPDTRDRRLIHLSLTPEAEPVTAAISGARGQFQERLFEGFSQEERLLYASLNHRLFENAEKYTSAERK